MCTVSMERKSVNPQFALFNYVFSLNADMLITVASIKRTLSNMGVDISDEVIEESFGKWRRTGMLHKEGDGYKLGSY